jgi:hypothetical protein
MLNPYSLYASQAIAAPKNSTYHERPVNIAYSTGGNF